MCQVKDWANHKQNCLAIYEFSEKCEKAEPGRGDGEDSSVFVSHLTPQGQEKLSKLVGRKCLSKCRMNVATFQYVKKCCRFFVLY